MILSFSHVSYSTKTNLHEYKGTTIRSWNKLVGMKQRMFCFRCVITGLVHGFDSIVSKCHHMMLW